MFLSISCSFAGSFLLFLRRSRKSFRISSSKYCFLPPFLSRSVGPPPHFPGISHERLRRARAAASLLSCNLMRCIFSTARVISPGLPVQSGTLRSNRTGAFFFILILAYPTSHHMYTVLCIIRFFDAPCIGGPYSRPTDHETVFPRSSVNDFEPS